MPWLVAVLDKDKNELLQLPFENHRDAQTFARAAMKGYRVRFTVVYENLEKRFGYHYDEENEIESLIW